MLLAPPHVSYIIGFCSIWTRPGQWRNLLQSFLVEARAYLAAPPVCPLARPQFVHSWTTSFSSVFLSFSQQICLPLLSVLLSAICMSSHMQNWPYSIRLAVTKGPCALIFSNPVLSFWMWKGQCCRRFGGGGGWGEEKCYYTIMEENNNRYQVVLAARLCSIFFTGVKSWSRRSRDMKVARHWEQLCWKQWFTNCYYIFELLEPSDWSHKKCVHINIIGVCV